MLKQQQAQSKKQPPRLHFRERSEEEEGCVVCARGSNALEAPRFPFSATFCGGQGHPPQLLTDGFWDTTPCLSCFELPYTTAVDRGILQ